MRCDEMRSEVEREMKKAMNMETEKTNEGK
jgi:hypothetical protein